MLGPIQAVPANDVPTFITVIHGFFLGSPLPSHLQTYRGHRLYNSDSLIHHPIFKELHAIQLIVRPCRSQHHITLIIMLPASQPHRPQVSFPDPSNIENSFQNLPFHSNTLEVPRLNRKLQSDPRTKSRQCLPPAHRLPKHHIPTFLLAPRYTTAPLYTLCSSHKI